MEKTDDVELFIPNGVDPDRIYFAKQIIDTYYRCRAGTPVTNVPRDVMQIVGPLLLLRDRVDEKPGQLPLYGRALLDVEEFIDAILTGRDHPL
jgi:hypothetical protein